MQKLSLSLVTLAALAMVSVAHADLQEYTASAEANQEAACPSIMSVQVQSKKDSLMSAKVQVRLEDGQTLVGKKASFSRQCLSDIVCEGSDDFFVPVAKDSDLVSITHNNAGDYPTTDLPGFKRLLLIQTKADSSQSSCYYDLNLR